MSKYFVKYEGHSKAKNNAETAADQYAEKQDGILLLGVQVKEEFIKQVKNDIDKINLKYSRCRDVRFSTWSQDAFNIGIGEGLCYLRIYKVNKEL